ILLDDVQHVLERRVSHAATRTPGIPAVGVGDAHRQPPELVTPRARGDGDGDHAVQLAERVLRAASAWRANARRLRIARVGSGPEALAIHDPERVAGRG